MVAPALVEATASTLRLRLQAPATDGGDKLSALEVQVAAEGKQGDEAAFRCVHNGVRVCLRVVVCVSLRLCVLFCFSSYFPTVGGGAVSSVFECATRAVESGRRAVCAALSTEVTVADLQRGTSYAVRARAVNAIGAGPFSPTVVFSTRAGVGESCACVRVRPQSSGGAGREFKYASDFDENGLLFHIGTEGGRGSWRNPMQAGLVAVTSSSQRRGEPHMVVGREGKLCYTKSEPNSWFAIDLGAGHSIRPTHYTLRHGENGPHCRLRHWKLQGGDDGASWTDLRTHVNDAALPIAAHSTASWPLAPPDPRAAYRHFRVLQTGKNSINHDYVMVCGFEVYGAVDWA
jgi:hypothetical protein